MPTQSSSGTAAPTPGVLGTQRWKRLLPIVFVTYAWPTSTARTTRIAVAGGHEGGPAHHRRRLGVHRALFFLGYFAFQIPGALYAERRSVKNLIFWCLIAWGVLASVQGLLTNVRALIVVRFLRRRRRGRRAPRDGHLPEPLVHQARARPGQHVPHPRQPGHRAVAERRLRLPDRADPWRGMFIIEGLPAVIWAFVFRKLVADQPRDADVARPRPSATR